MLSCKNFKSYLEAIKNPHGFGEGEEFCYALFSLIWHELRVIWNYFGSFAAVTHTLFQFHVCAPAGKPLARLRELPL